MAQTHDFSQGKISKNIMSLALPMTAAQLINVLYSVVDRIYIGNIPEVGSLALAGAGVCGPIVTMLGSVAFWVGVGGSPLVSIRLGEGRREQAKQIVANAFLLLIVMSLALMGVAYATRRPALMLFGASPETLPYAMEYYSWYLTGTVFALLSTGMNQFVICQGFAQKGMQSVILGAVMNIVLDPLFIFGLKMGVKGAAIATVLSQLCSCLFVLHFLFGPAPQVGISFGGYRPWLMGRILLTGLTPFLIIAVDNLMIIVLNALLQRYGGESQGDLLVAAATISQSFMLVVTMPLGGISAGRANRAIKYTAFRKADRGRASCTFPMPVNPSTMAYCSPRGIRARVQMWMAERASAASSGSVVKRRTKRAPPRRASRNRAVT